jgi:hypothetical protein
MVVVKTSYTTITGRNRTSYGCGYTQQSALYDLRNDSWDWKPEMGYEVVESIC